LAHHTLAGRRSACGQGLIAIGASLLAVTLVAWGPAVASACGQTPPSAAAPAPAWTGSGSTDLSWQAAAIDQFTIGFAANISKLTPRWSYFIQADYTYGTVTVGGVEQRVADSQHVRFLAERTLTPRTYLLLRPAFKRNELQGVDFQFEELVGYGLRVVTSDRTRLNLVPIGGAIQQRKRVDGVDGHDFAAGLYQTLGYRVTSDWNLVQWFLYLQDVRQARDHRLQGSATLAGRIMGPAPAAGAPPGGAARGLTVSLTLTYRIDRENIAFAESAENDQRLSVGVAFGF
jgi:hypothetical protein